MLTLRLEVSEEGYKSNIPGTERLWLKLGILFGDWLRPSQNSALPVTEENP